MTTGSLRKLTDWIAKRLGQDETDEQESRAGFNLAVAVLLVEVLRADFDVSAAERRQVLRSIGDYLGLGAAEAEALFEQAERRIDESYDLYQFTSQINRACGETEKVALLEQLWRVANADERIHKYEEHLIRRVADLLHVPHSAFIAAKLKAVH